MSLWIVAPVVMIAWFAILILELCSLEIAKLKKGVPEGEVSASFAGHLVMPIIILVIATQFDDGTNSHWGTTIALWIHVAMIVYSVVAYFYYGLQIRALRKELKNKQPSE